MRNKKGLLIAVSVLAAILILFILSHKSGIPSFLNTDSKNYQTSVVDRGKVIIPLDATGIVEPENEVILLSPLTSIVRKDKKRAG